MFRIVFIAGALLATTLSAFAQDNLVGDWSGSYRYTGITRGDADFGIVLSITKVEGNVVSGTAKTTGGACAGDYQMRGKLDGASLGMISTNTAGSAGDCKFGFRAKIDGNSMVGTVGNFAMRLSKK